MYRLIILLTAVLFSVSIVAETVYKKTKPDGSFEFTDQASPDSEEIKVRKPTTYTAPPLPKLTLPSKKLSPTFNYELAIVQPTNDTTIHNKSDITVSVALQPKLISAYKHQIRYQLAGQSIISESNTVTFKNVDRGTHQINVSVINADGESVSSVVSTTFHLKRFFKKPTPPKIKPKAP